MRQLVDNIPETGDLRFNGTEAECCDGGRHRADLTKGAFNAMSAETVASDIDVFSRDNLVCPHGAWAALRSQCPVRKVHIPATGTDGYMLTRKRDIEYAATHPEIFSSTISSKSWRWGSDLGPDFADLFDGRGYKPVHTLATSDPPAALKYRKIALEALSQKRVQAKADVMKVIIDDLIAKMPRGAAFDFKQTFAIPLPILVMLEIFGLPTSEADFVFDSSLGALNLFDPASPLDVAREGARSLIAFQEYIEPFVNKYRHSPEENFLSFLANVRADDDQFLSMEEVMSIAFISLSGGSDTTRNAIAEAALALAKDKALWHSLRENPAKIDSFVEEIVRTSSPALVSPRQTRVEVEIDGTVIPKDSAVYLMWGSGSYDEEFFDNPSEVRLDRKMGRNHTSFGHGLHSCAGIHLARLELVMSVRAWLESFNSIELAIPADEIAYEPLFLVRSMEKLPLIVT